jgi:hypothetical protein
MSGRRSHPRVVVIPTAEGRIRLLRDVIVQQIDSRGVVAISREPGTLGETLVLELPTGHNVNRLHVRVVESRPQVVDGNVTHRLQLEAVVEAAHPIVPTVQPSAER